jgi:glutathione S-transferase
MITISAFKWVPEFAYGQVRDLRARWALEEAGIPYKTCLLKQGDQDKPDYRALQPFGQVPLLQDGDFTLFESGAIVLYIGERSETLLPKDPVARAHATQWLIAALNSVEPFLMNVALIDLFYANEEWAKLRRPGAVDFAKRRLAGLSKSLGDKAWRPLHGWRSHDDDGAAHPEAHRRRHQRQAPRRLYRPLHSAACLQARPRCTGRRLQGSRVAAWPRRTFGKLMAHQAGAARVGL